MNIGQLTAMLTVNAAQLNLAAGALKKFQTEANTSLNAVQLKLDAVSTSMKTFGTAMSIGLTLPIVGLGAIATKTFREYELNLAHIIGLTGTSRDQTMQWSAQLLELAKSTAQGPNKLADALYFIASSGIDDAQAMDVLTASAKSAAAGLGDVNKVADLVTSALNAYKGTGLTAAQVTDQLTAAVREGKAEAPGFAEAIGYAIPIASQLGVSFDQVAAAMASVSGVGVDVNTAALYLRQVLSDLLKPSHQAEQALNDMGTSSAKLREELASKGLLPLLTTLSTLTAKYGKTMADVFPEVRALTEVLALTGKNVGHVSEIFNLVANSTGDMEKALKPVTETLDFKFRQAITNSQLALIKLGDALKGTVSDALNWIAKAIENVSNWFSSFSDANKKTILTITLLVAAMGPFLLILSALAKAFQILNLAVITSPFGVLVAIIGIATTALSLFLNRTQTVSKAQSYSRLTLDEYNQSLADQERNIKMANTAIDMRIKKLKDLDLEQLKVLKSDIQQQITIAENVVNPPTKQITDAFKKAQDEIKAQLTKTPGLTLKDMGFDQTEINKLNFDQIVKKVEIFSAETKKNITDAQERFNKLTKQMELTDAAISKLEKEKATVDVSGYTKATDILKKYELELSKIDLRAEALGITEETLKDKFNATKKALDDFAEAKIISGDDVQKLQNRLLIMNNALKDTEKWGNMLPDTFDNSGIPMDNFVGHAEDIANSFVKVSKESEKLQKRLANMAMNTTMDSVLGGISDVKQISKIQELSSHLADLQKQFIEAFAAGEKLDSLKMQNLVGQISNVSKELNWAQKTFSEKFNIISGGILDLVNSVSGYINQQKQNELDYVEQIAKKENKSQEWVAAQQDAINKKYGKKLKGYATAAAIINIAQGITKAFAEYPLPIAIIMSGLVAAAGAVQIATIQAQKFAKGGIVPPGYGNDTYPALLTSGEMVTPPGKLPMDLKQMQVTIAMPDGEWKIKGRDLVYIIDETKRQYKNAY